MTPFITKPPAHPERGRGHYSADRRRWWDDSEQEWLELDDAAADTAEIQLEESGGESWISSILATLGAQEGHGYYRFVGIARSSDVRWPTYRIPGDTFPAARGFLADVPAEEKWSPGMTRSLLNLQAELLSEGWLPVGQGDAPWATRYRRTCLATKDRRPATATRRSP